MDNKVCVEFVVDYIADEYAKDASLVEVGVGERDEVASELAERGYDVTATDVRDVGNSVGDGVRFVRDDIREADETVYKGADVVYSLRPPYELHAAIAEVGRSAGADTLLVPLADEGVNIDAELVNRDGFALYVRRQ